MVQSTLHTTLLLSSLLQGGLDFLSVWTLARALGAQRMVEKASNPQPSSRTVLILIAAIKHSLCMCFSSPLPRQAIRA